MIFPNEAEPAEAWIESEEAKGWARVNLTSEPPYQLHSPERDRVIQEIRADRDLIEQICVQSFWELGNSGNDNNELRSEEGDGDDDATETRTEIIRIRALRKRIDKNTVMIAPWRLLPTELLSLIFEYMRDTIITNTSWTSEFIASLTPVGHVVSQVCSRWREVAHLTPKCWTDINLRDQGIPSQLLEKWLERSKASPLSITFVESNQRLMNNSRPLLKHVGRIKSLLFSTRARFHSHMVGGFDFEDIEHSPVPLLPKFLDGAVRLTHLTLPFGLFRGTRYRNMQIELPSIQSISGIESYELKTLRPDAAGDLRYVAIQDPESKCEYMTLLRQCARVAPGLESLDLTNWAVVINDASASATVVNHPVQPNLKKLYLPKHAKILHTLDRQMAYFPKLTVLSLHSQELGTNTSIPSMPNLTCLNFRSPKTAKPAELNPYILWLHQCPNLRVMILEATMWIHKSVIPNLMHDLYMNAFTAKFAWDQLDRSRLYAWDHPWCICIAKKNELRLYDHFLNDMRPTVWIEGHEFPYTINLCWVDFEKKIGVVANRVRDLGGGDEADVDDLW